MKHTATKRDERAEHSAVIYVRVSTEEQANGYSLESQEERCRTYASQQNYTVLAVVRDMHSGEDLDRPGLTQVFDLADTTPFAVLIVYDLDRFSRGGPAHCAIIEKRLEHLGVTVAYVLGNFNDGSPEAMLTKYIKQSISWYENQQRRERIIRGRTTAVKFGRVMTGALSPFGYTYTDGRLEIDAEEADVVQRIFDCAQNGQTANQIATTLSAAGILTRADKTPQLTKRNKPGIWHTSTVLKILHNPVYTGVWHYNKRGTQKDGAGKRKLTPRPVTEWLPVQVPALIDAAQFAQVQAQIDANRVQAKRNTRRQYLLQHRVYCACGAVCSCETDTRYDLRFYVCHNRRRRVYEVPCTVRFMIKADTLEPAIWGVIEQALLDPHHLRAWIVAQRSATATNRRHLEQTLAAIAAAQAEVDRKLGMLLDHSLTHDFPLAIIEERKRLLLDERQRLAVEERQALAALATVTLTDEQEATLLAIGERIRTGLAQLDFAARRQILQLLQVRIDVIERRRVRITALVPLGAATAPTGHTVGLQAELDLESGQVNLLNGAAPAAGGGA